MLNLLKTTEPVMVLATGLAGVLGAVGIVVQAPVIAIVLMFVLPLVIGLVQRAHVVPAVLIEDIDHALDLPVQDATNPDVPVVGTSPEPTPEEPAPVETPAAPAATPEVAPTVTTTATPADV